MNMNTWYSLSTEYVAEMYMCMWNVECGICFFGRWNAEYLRKEVREQSSGVRVPVRDGIVANSIIRRCVSVDMQLGSLPSMLLLLITIECTRELSTPTLYHLQTGVAVSFHPDLFSQ